MLLSGNAGPSRDAEASQAERLAQELGLSMGNRIAAFPSRMGQPVVHFELQGQDREALTRFYQQLFGWKTSDIVEMNYTMVETGGDGGINGGIGTTPQGAPGGVTFYVHSDDVAGSLKQAQELGGRPVAGPMDMPDGHKWALFADPEGHVVRASIPRHPG